jgi:hypothetical protein
MVKTCFSDGHDCWRHSCDVLSASGSVELCSRHGNPHGLFTRKLVGFEYRSPVFNKHRSR